MKEFDKGNKLVIAFEGKQKVLICNKTNANRIAYAYGTNTNNWIGIRSALCGPCGLSKGSPQRPSASEPPMKTAPSVAAGNGNYELKETGQFSTGGPRNERSPQPPMRRGGDDPSDEIPF
jgi:hypothetical protein